MKVLRDWILLILALLAYGSATAAGRLSMPGTAQNSLTVISVGRGSPTQKCHRLSTPLEDPSFVDEISFCLSVAITDRFRTWKVRSDLQETLRRVFGPSKGIPSAPPPLSTEIIRHTCLASAIHSDLYHRPPQRLEFQRVVPEPQLTHCHIAAPTRRRWLPVLVHSVLSLKSFLRVSDSIMEIATSLGRAGDLRQRMGSVVVLRNMVRSPKRRTPRPFTASAQFGRKSGRTTASSF